jgi:hypothetical protein
LILLLEICHCEISLHPHLSFPPTEFLPFNVQKTVPFVTVGRGLQVDGLKTVLDFLCSKGNEPMPDNVDPLVQMWIAVASGFGIAIALVVAGLLIWELAYRRPARRRLGELWGIFSENFNSLENALIRGESLADAAAMANVLLSLRRPILVFATMLKEDQGKPLAQPLEEIARGLNDGLIDEARAVGIFFPVKEMPAKGKPRAA